LQKRDFLVHNGIIENYKELKEKLIKEGHKFVLETDTEIMCHLIEKYCQGNLEGVVKRIIKNIRGAYAIAVISKKPSKNCYSEKVTSFAFENK
jgi:glucosamine--fructose-6-phosphate aminotransferase (isomerizing)